MWRFYLLNVALLYLFEMCLCGSWFSFRLMRNPGLVADTATSSDDCISKCASTTGCSAISWQPSKLACLKSMCNNLDLFYTTGWNTYVLNSGYVLESEASAPAPALEWMLTDSCGNSSQGLRDGPKMNLYGTTYSNSSSVYAGNAATFSRSKLSYGRTDPSSAVNFPMNNESLTVMFWINFAAVPYSVSLLEFVAPQDSRDMVYWYVVSGFTDESTRMKLNGYPAISPSVVYAFTPAVNTWYHVAYVYDGAAGIITLFFNYNAVGVQKYRLINLFNNWQYFNVGRCFCDDTSVVNGAIYCVKILNKTISSSQVAALGESCKLGKVRLSK